MKCDAVQIRQLPQPVYLWQVPDGVAVKVQDTQFSQLAQNLEHKPTQPSRFQN